MLVFRGRHSGGVACWGLCGATEVRGTVVLQLCFTILLWEGARIVLQCPKFDCVVDV